MSKKNVLDYHLQPQIFCCYLTSSYDVSRIKSYHGIQCRAINQNDNCRKLGRKGRSTTTASGKSYQSGFHVPVQDAAVRPRST